MGPPAAVRPPAEPAALVRAAAAGDRTGWDELVARYTGLLWSVARAHRLDDATAADVVQTTWVRLLEHLSDLREPAAVGGWLATTARHECLRVIRAGHREQVTADEALDRVDTGGPALDAALLQRERDAALWSALQELSDRCRTLLRVLMASPPPSYAEVSAALDVPVGSIGPTRERCLRKMRTLVETAGVGPRGEDA